MPKFNLGWLKDKNGEKFAPKTFISQILNNDGSLFKDRVESIENKLIEHDNKIVNNEVIDNIEKRITNAESNITNNINSISTINQQIIQIGDIATKNSNDISSLSNQVFIDNERITKHEKYYSPTQFILTDVINGYDYIVQMQNGNLVSFCKIIEIRVDKLPDKMSYFSNEPFDPTGMKVVCVCQDGSTKEITNYIYSNIINGIVTITYQYNDDKYTTSISVNVLSMEDLLVDFGYTKNGNGTYTITTWKQTLNGEPSTEMVVPDSNLINI